MKIIINFTDTKGMTQFINNKIYSILKNANFILLISVANSAQSILKWDFLH